MGAGEETNNNMNIFISYSVSDTHAVTHIANGLKGLGTVNYWAESKEPGKEAWPLIFSWIDSADIVFVLVSGKTLRRAMSVGQEVGHAKSRNKLVVPLVEEGVPSSELGALGGVTYIKFNPHDLTNALATAQTVVAKRKAEIAEGNTKALLAVGGIFALIAALSD